MVGELRAVSSTDSDDNTLGVALTSASFPRVDTALSVVVENLSHITALKNGAASVSNQLLNLIEQQMVKLLARQGVACFEALNVFFRQRHSNVVALG